MIQRLIDDTYGWFVGIVSERRSMSMAEARALADGSIFTGAQGLSNGLVDEIGDEETARKWLVSEKGISDDLKIVTWKPDRSSTGLVSNPAGLGGRALYWIARQFGVDLGPDGGVMREMLPERLFLDGLVSMLHIRDDENLRGPGK